MARSAHAYVRGATVEFYEWLASIADDELPQGPAVWICGDCHLGNLGPLAERGGRVSVQIRDLDQTVIGNPAHDLVRLGLSLASAARGSDLTGVTTALMLEQMIRGYQLARRSPSEDDAVPEASVVRTVRRRAMGRKWKHLASERIEDVRPEIPLGKKFWKLTGEERRAIDQLVADKQMLHRLLALEGGDGLAGVEVADAAYWMKGCSSLGKLRFAVLVEMKGQAARIATPGGCEGAGPAAAPAAVGAHMPKDHAERVVTGARALSPNLGERMAAASLFQRSVVVRELTPQDLKLEVDQFSKREAVDAARYLAYIVGHAHARQMDEAARSAWHNELKHHQSTDDAPNWLWSTVVKLAARHEEGYLEHCRRYALGCSI